MVSSLLSATRWPSSVFRIAIARRGALLFALLWAVSFGVVFHLGAPGYLSMDSGVQLEDARSFHLHDTHPVLMALIWRYLDQRWPGPVGMFGLLNGINLAGLALLSWSAPGSLAARMLALVGLAFFPPLFINVPMLVKDFMMQGGLLAAAGLFLCARRWGSWAWLGVGLGVVFAVVGLGARYDAPVAAWPLLALPFLGAASAKSRARGRGLLRALVLGLVLTLGLTIGSRRALRPISEAEEFWQLIPMFDLVGMSVAARQVLISPDVAQFSQGMNVKELELRYNRQYNLSVLYCFPYRQQGCAPAFRTSLDPDELKHLVHNWLWAIVKHPAAYFKHRTRVARPLLGFSPPPGKPFYASTTPHHPLGAQYPPSERSLAIMHWFDAHVGDAWFRPWVYALLGCLLLPLAVVRYQRGSSPLALLWLLSGLGHLSCVIAATGSPEYRYTVWTTLCTLVAAYQLVFERGLQQSAGWADGVERVGISKPSEPSGVPIRGT
jgi:hypothetical protein